MIEVVSQKNTAKKIERKNEKDKQGVKNSIRLASNHIGDAYNFLNGNFKEYDTSGVKEKISIMREKLADIEKILE